MSEMNIPESLIEKYNVPVPRYTSYPPANFFSSSYTANDFRDAVIGSNTEEPRNISVYLHIPFCPRLCYYCGCNTHITRNEELKSEYLVALMKEISMLKPLLDTERKVSQVHWGGGTPNSLTVGQISTVMDFIRSNFSFIDNPEIAIECNPAHLDHTYLETLLNIGFNRISLGVQDFSQKVLEVVNREIPAIPVKEFVDQVKSSGKAKVNLDFIYGLPSQTVESFRQTIDRAISIDPDRMVTFSYAHIPNLKPSQKILEDVGLVPADVKLTMFQNTYNTLKKSGYIPIGLDHFAKENDELAVALRNKKLHRNFQGYCTRETTGQVYAFGVTAISQMESGYAQNTKSVEKYINLINRGEFTTEKGYTLTPEQKIIRHVINELMCNNYISWPETAQYFNTTLSDIHQAIGYNNNLLQIFQDEKLLTFDDREIKVTETGRFFIRNIASAFDPGIINTGKTFSKAL